MKSSFVLLHFTLVLCITAIPAIIKPEIRANITTDQNFGTNQIKKHEAYTLYKQYFNKPNSESNLEYRRYTTFHQNVEKIRQHNERYKRGEETFKMAINKFADMLPEESKKLNGYRYEKKQLFRRKNIILMSANSRLPEKIDWRIKGAVTPVKDQGNCGSCWAFSSTGALEGQYHRRTGHLVSLSEQNLLDCSESYGNFGCDGGLMDYAFDYIKANDGIDSEASYPYEAKEGKCRYSNRTRILTDSGEVDLPEGDEEALQKAVAKIGPVSAAINSRYLSLYEEGIFSHDNCSMEELDHGILVVGYGSEKISGKNNTVKHLDYWIIKNSWGDDWGENGYFRLVRNKDNMCGIASAASYPLVSKKMIMTWMNRLKMD
ncbi:Cathepsin [Dirofilaria immitis]